MDRTGASDAYQPGLSGQPGIIQAHKRHLRLVRCFGREPVALAFAVADHISRLWHERGEHDATFRAYMLAFHGPDWQAAPASPTVAAAIYPQAVALTRLLASPHWQAMSAPGPGDGRGLFIAELRRTVAPRYRWPPPHRPPDPLGTWINQRCIPGYGPLFNYHSWPNSGVADTRRCSSPSTR
jgi:hypothetical protein